MRTVGAMFDLLEESRGVAGSSFVNSVQMKR